MDFGFCIFQVLAENDLGVVGTKHIVDVIKKLDSVHSLSLAGKCFLKN